MTLANAVQKRIRELLIKEDISMYKLARIGGISPNTAQGLMSKKYRSVNLRTVMQIIQAFEMTPSEFFDSPLFIDPNLEVD
ncbi:MAG: helix-turn-helix transcriptional regulator [Christensenellaceae bacterium]|jgi:transcriptional regulator with XRE-family HTH domain|nr:helix-turn-helix transcriptional regulator [Christensenellaceae bacterium]